VTRLTCLALIVVALTGCSSRTTARQHAKLASLEFDIPADWHRADLTRPDVSTSEWTPEANERSEAVTIIRTTSSPAVAKAGVPALEPLLAAAQRSLTNAHASRVTRVTTARGLSGARIEVDFVPPGKQQSYHRIHVVLVDERSTSLIHVLYTAKSPDDELDALTAVLDTIRSEEA